MLDRKFWIPALAAAVPLAILANGLRVAAVAAQLKAGRVLNRTYIGRSTGVVANIFVAWFQSQRNGDRQPHSPKVCLPGAGWAPVETGEIGLAPGLRVNRYIVVNRGSRAAPSPTSGPPSSGW
jgi:hypothetical protein